VQRTLLVPLDGSEVSEASLPWATRLAQEHGLSLTLARVTEYPFVDGAAYPEGSLSAEAHEQILVTEQDAAGRYLDGVRQRLADTALRIDTVVRHGSPSVALLDLTDELNATAIVMASHGRSGVKRFVLGSVAMQLVSRATTPVFLVRAATPDARHTPALSRLLVPLDGSVLASRALEIAREMATAGTSLVLVRVVPWPRTFVLDDASERPRDAEATAYGVRIATDYLEQIAASLRDAGLSVETQVIVSETTSAVSRHLAVAAATWKVDAIVMSTHGRGGVTGWMLGSVADELTRNVDRPVLLVSARALAARATGQMCVGDVMTRDVLTLREDESLLVALRKLVRQRASGAPVLAADERLVGVISQRDIMGWYERTIDALGEQAVPAADEYARRLQRDRVRDVMMPSPVSIQESASLASALALLRERGVHRLPVTREGRVVGILTGSDVLLAMLAQIESAHDANRRAELSPAPELLGTVQAGG
jgi:nucleotide-binding universal stress UspA family protein